MKNISSRMFVIALLINVLLLSSITPNVAEFSGWSIETVDGDGDVGMYNSLSIDNNGNPHIAYLDRTDGSLKYARWISNHWDIEVVDYLNNWTGISMALDILDNPHICYMNNGSLKYAHWTSNRWSVEILDEEGELGEITLKLDSSGQAHVSYYDELTKNIKYIYHSNDVWNPLLVDSVEELGTNSLALDNNDIAHLAYYADGVLKYAKRTGEQWSIETVDSGPETGALPCIALDSNGAPQISYDEITPPRLKYAQWTGSYWNIVTLDENLHLWGTFSSLSLNKNNYPHISYSDYQNNLKFIYWTGSRWNVEYVDQDIRVTAHISLVLDEEGHAHIGYYDWNTQSLKYARSVDPIGSFEETSITELLHMIFFVVLLIAGIVGILIFLTVKSSKGRPDRKTNSEQIDDCFGYYNSSIFDCQICTADEDCERNTSSMERGDVKIERKPRR